MATLGGESQSFPSAALAAAAGVGGGGGGSGALGLQAPLNRGLERALEEAAHSGGLNLSGRKLKEFPRSAAALSHDLSDTVRAGEPGRAAGGAQGAPGAGLLARPGPPPRPFRHIGDPQPPCEASTRSPPLRSPSPGARPPTEAEPTPISPWTLCFLYSPRPGV